LKTEEEKDKEGRRKIIEKKRMKKGEGK